MNPDIKLGKISQAVPMTRGQLWLLGAFGALVAVTWINPPWPAEQALHS